jgi:hypothetical protein
MGTVLTRHFPSLARYVDCTPNGLPAGRPRVVSHGQLSEMRTTPNAIGWSSSVIWVPSARSPPVATVTVTATPSPLSTARKVGLATIGQLAG